MSIHQQLWSLECSVVEIVSSLLDFTETNRKQLVHNDVNNNDKLILGVWLLYPVFLSDVLSDVIGVTRK